LESSRCKKLYRLATFTHRCSTQAQPGISPALTGSHSEFDNLGSRREDSPS
jgi:hypothetical protein